jgi:nitric oxide reductase NorD protein
MSSLRHLWFDTRHLLGDEPGQILSAELEALTSGARETILTTGDRLAEVSLTLAQAFCRKAPAAWHVFGSDAFPRWAAIGEHLAGQDPPSRDGAVAYFTIEPQALSELGLDQTEEWVSIGREVLGVSRRLGAQFFQASAPLLADLPAPFGPRLRAWAEQGRMLLGCKGWKGEFLAVSYFSSAPAALPFLTPEEMTAWAKLGVLVQESGPWTFYTRLPDGFLNFSPTQRVAFLLNAHEAAAHSAAAAQEIFFSLPPTLCALTQELQSFYLSALAPVIRLDPQPVPALFPLLGPIAKAVQLEQQPRLQETLLHLAQTFPAGMPALIRTLPRAYEETGESGLQEWLGKGLAIAQDNAEAGVAYFALESRTSFNVLQQASPGIDLEEVQELLRKYIQMLTGSTVGIRRQEFFSYPPPLEESPEYGEDLPLPGRIEVFETYEENFRLYRGLAALQAGRREFGTYTFSLSTLWPDLSPPIRHIMHEDATPMGGLAEYFRCFPHPDILEALFLLIETQRVQDHLGTAYRGLSADMDWISRLSLPSLLPVASFQSSIFSILNTEHWQLNTVYNSATTAAEIYIQLLSSFVKARLQKNDASEFGSVFFDKLTGDALIDPDMEDDSLPPEGTIDIPELALEDETDDQDGGSPLSAEELKALIEAGVDLQIRQGKQEKVTPQGLYVSDLDGKIPTNDEMEQIAAENDPAIPGVQPRRQRDEGLTFYYDEWDYQIADYRTRWCRLREIILHGDAGEFFAKTLSDYTALTPAIKHEFQRIRPEQYRQIRGLEDGEEFDLDAAVTAAVDMRAGLTPSSKLYTKRRQTERDVAALFLLDMSASTDEPIVQVERDYTDDDVDDWQSMWKKRPVVPRPKPRRIIDVTKETLVLMSEALEEIGDAYAIYGFSGQGKDNVEFYHVKSFSEALSPTVKGRIGAIEPKRSTRMGPAVRHAMAKLKDMACRVKLLILLSDGFPQDMDYGSDRRSTTYGIRDTMIALREAEEAGVLTFCLTVDKAGHDYLREMCEPSRYMVLDDVASLPTELPKVYQRYLRPRAV